MRRIIEKLAAFLVRLSFALGFVVTAPFVLLAVAGFLLYQIAEAFVELLVAIFVGVFGSSSRGKNAGSD